MDILVTNFLKYSAGVSRAPQPQSDHMQVSRDAPGHGYVFITSLFFDDKSDSHTAETVSLGNRVKKNNVLLKSGDMHAGEVRFIGSRDSRYTSSE